MSDIQKTQTEAHKEINAILQKMSPEAVNLFGKLLMHTAKAEVEKEDFKKERDWLYDKLSNYIKTYNPAVTAKIWIDKELSKL